MKGPLILTRKGWYPPKGVSALPDDIQKMVPENLQYWKEADTDRRKIMLDTLRDMWNGEEFKPLIRITKSNYEKQWAFGIALAPNEIDSYGDIETPDEIADAIAAYMLNVWKGDRPEVVGKQHEEPIEAIPIQCFQAPVDFWYDDSPHTPEYMVPKGAWVLGIHILDKKEFEKVVSGEYIGFSMQGTGVRRKVE